jgi:hypothetical protein
LPAKNLLGVPWLVAFALQADGWILRTDIIWEKSSCLPESAKDRLTRSHEYIFLFSKTDDYYYDPDPIRELTGNEATWEEYEAARGRGFHDHKHDGHRGMMQRKNPGFRSVTHPLGRNCRTVWRSHSRGSTLLCSPRS